MKISKRKNNGIEILTAENGQIKTEIAPGLGGKIVSIYNKQLQKEFLWSNENLPLAVHQPGDDFDSNFWGGIDELIPNDIPEIIDSVQYPDHGELWITPLQYDLEDDKISIYGHFKLSGLYYQKDVYLDTKSPIIYLQYKIKNKTNLKRNFLWKLHAALAIEEGDKLITSAQKAKVADPDYSRFADLDEFNWPIIENIDASIVSLKSKSVDFFYLYNIEQGEMKFLNGNENHLFSYIYEKKVFPFQWYFASYGGFFNHYTVILEPSTNMPLSVNEAKLMGKCAVLEPNQEINTVVQIYAGENI